MRCVVEVPDHVKCHVIGKEGRKKEEIERETGVKIKFEQNETILEGSEEAIEAAKEMIRSIIDKRSLNFHKTISFPLDSFGLVLGTRGATIQSIEIQTITKIELERNVDPALAHIRGATEERCNAAEQKILKAALRTPQRFEKLAFVDGTYVGEDNEFELEECRDFTKLMYKLTMHGDKLSEPKKADNYILKLEKPFLETLHKISKENQESKNLRTDMWCHFGHAYIHNVDEDDVGKFYQIEDVNKNLQKQKDMWKVEFKEGLETELVDLEGILCKEPYKVKPKTRFDYTFRCPSGREVRFKTFSVKSSSDPDGVSFIKYKPLIPMKNVLFVESTESIKYYLCAPNTHRLKVDIFFPYLKLDCHLVVQTTLKDTSKVRDEEETLKETSTVRDDEEDQILNDFLIDNLKLKEGKLELQEDLLPDGFAITYWRECKRRTYLYKSNKMDFHVTISKEKSRDYIMENDIRTKTDILLHCDELDKLLGQEDWEPEAIVSKLPDFLNFVRDVQSNISP